MCKSRLSLYDHHAMTSHYTRVSLPDENTETVMVGRRGELELQSRPSVNPSCQSYSVVKRRVITECKDQTELDWQVNSLKRGLNSCMT